MISRWRQRECLVIALYGAWGSGKSSVKNLILEKLAEEKYRLAPIEFNPWLAPGVEKITETFFTEIGVKLFGETDESDKQRAAKWKRYADYLEIGSYVTAVTAPAIMEKGIRFLEGKAARQADSFEKKENSLQQMRKDLREAFRSLNTPIVIVIDDIDRLTEEEINLIFRLVKANADFPNLIFLLLFDRKTVETALDKISGEQGAAFLEKIVQVGIDLPPLSSDALSNVVFRGISEALEPLISENDFDRGRFSNLWIPGLSFYFQNLRDVNRFLSSFNFAVGAFSRNGVLEVNPVDLIAIETLRTTEPEVYGTIPMSMRWLWLD